MTPHEFVERYIRTDTDQTRPDASHCWSDTPSLAYYGCSRQATTDVGLCADHYEEIIPNAA